MAGASVSLVAWMPYIVLGFVALGILIFVHEFGHFLSAKAMRLKVTEFMFGLPGPKLLKWRRGETDYGVTAIPFGGYVKMAGSDPFEELSEEDEARSFTALSFPKKVGIMVSGPVTNIAFAFLVFVLFFEIVGVPKATTRIAEIVPGSAAAKVGLAPGDRIFEANGKPVDTWEALVAEIRPRPGQELAVGFERGGVTKRLTATLETTRGLGFLGVGPVVVDTHPGILTSVRHAWATEVGITGLILRAFTPAVFIETLPSMSGPVGITGEAAKAARRGVPDYLWLVAVVSLALGIFNLLPIPPLDGGRIVMSAVEAVRRKPLPQNVTIAILATGTSLLLTLMVYLVYVDVRRFIAS